MHKTIWFKIHWILGIAAGLVLLIVGFTGAMLSFEKEITYFINQKSFIVNVPMDKKKLSTNELLERFQINHPKAKINSITFSNELDASTVINVAGKGEGREARRGTNYYLNPYTAKVLPEIKGKEFFSLMLRLHRWLALEKELREVGKQTVALSTVALIVLSMSGLIIYWGRVKRAFFKSFTFKFKHTGRAFLSTMHSAIGMWVLPFYLLASLSGLYWSYDWYNKALYAIAGLEKPKRQQIQPQQTRNQQIATRQQNNTKFFEHQKAIEMFNVFVQNEYSTASVRFPTNGTTYSFSYLDKNPAHYRARNTLELDINSWQLLKHERYNDKPLNERLMRSILPLHSGEYFGIIGQTGMFLSSLLMVLFTVTGFILFINRKFKKKHKKSNI